MVLDEAATAGAVVLALAVTCLSCAAPPTQAPGPLGPETLEGLTIRIVGDDFNWHIRYPGADGLLDTDDDIETIRHLHVPAGRALTVELWSTDYLYTFALPHLRIKEIAVPDLPMTWELPPSAAGTYELRGDQLCGYSHEDLIGLLVVQPEGEFLRWLESLGKEREEG